MAKSDVKKNATNIAKKNANTRWDAAIEDAQRLIEFHRGEIMKLKASINVFAERKDEGVPWPTEKA